MKTQNQSPQNHYLCEAREPGAPSHEFPTPDAVSARCLCDAMGWEFIRVYKPGGDSDRPPGRQAAGDAALSKKQLTCLVTEANKSWKQLSNMGVISETFEAWRHAQVYATVRREGLSKCQSSHYKKLLNHFRSLRGVESHHLSQHSRQSREGGDTADRRQQIIHLIAATLGTHARLVDQPASEAETGLATHAISKGGAIGEAYLMSLAKAKNPGQTLHDVGCLIKLPSSRLEHLLFTLRNRIAAREGRGESKHRNKGQ